MEEGLRMAKQAQEGGAGGRQEALFVRLIEKAFYVLSAFDAGRPT